VWVAIATCLAVSSCRGLSLRPCAPRPHAQNVALRWRLAFPRRSFAFGALLAGWREVTWPVQWGLGPIATFARGHDAGRDRLRALAHRHLSKGMDDRRACRLRRARGIWGVRDSPDYHDVTACEAVQGAKRATFNELRAG